MEERFFARNAVVTGFVCLVGRKVKKKEEGGELKEKRERERKNICRSFQRFIRNTNRGVAT